MMQIERMRWHGIPLDVPTYRRTEQCGADVAASLRADLNRKLGAEVYYQGIFKRRTMFAVMRRDAIPIPVDPKTGKFSCATKLIKSMIETYPLLKEFYEDRRMIRRGEEPETGNRCRRPQPFLAQPVRAEDRPK